MQSKRKVGLYGWGLVAPRCPDVDTFARQLDDGESWLDPFDGFGPNNFLVGQPEFDFSVYHPWIVERFKPNRATQLEAKMGLPVLYAIGSFIQALGQNPGLEAKLQALGTRTQVIVGTGLGDFGTQYQQSLALYRAQRHWDRFWANTERNTARQAFEAGNELTEADRCGAPPVDPEAVPPSPHGAHEDERDEMEDAWWGFWAHHSPELRQYLAEQREIEGVAVVGNVEAGKLSAMKEKQRRLRRLRKSWGAPEPPWQAVSSNVLWNIDNIAAAQISMLGHLTGATYGVAGACSTFGLALKLGLDAIHRGEADAVVIGATDPPPHPLTVGGFYSARVISADAQLSKPLTQLRGTHIAGGAAVWILGARDVMDAEGFEPLGMEPIGIGITSDADHIITPSQEGPTEAMHLAFADAGMEPSEMVHWDLHATATPGDFNEVEMVDKTIGGEVLVSARKGTFGHGMAAGGGWELTAQYLGYQRGRLYPTPLAEDELHHQIGEVHRHFVYNKACDVPRGPVGKLSMGVGGINACVVSRPLDDE